MQRVEIGTATLYLADFREALWGIEPPEAIVTDPPYGMSYRSRHNTASGRDGMLRKDGDFRPINGDTEPFDPSFLLAYKVPTVLWGANYYADKLPASGSWLVWDKLAGKTPTPSSADVEMAWTNLQRPSRIMTHLWRGIMRAGEENVSRGPKLHPNQKPVALMDWCLRQLPPVQSVVDTHMGSASLGVAAMRRGLRYIGIDNDPEHFATACRRLEAEARKLDAAA